MGATSEAVHTWVLLRHGLFNKGRMKAAGVRSMDKGNSRTANSATYIPDMSMSRYGQGIGTVGAQDIR